MYVQCCLLGYDALWVTRVVTNVSQQKLVTTYKLDHTKSKPGRQRWSLPQ
jgi:hypothetical protein